MTNALLGVLSARVGGLPAAYELVEPVAMWLFNVGMVVFFVLYVAMDVTHGAWVMGAGVFVAVLAMVRSLYHMNERETPRAGAV